MKPLLSNYLHPSIISAAPGAYIFPRNLFSKPLHVTFIWGKANFTHR